MGDPADILDRQIGDLGGRLRHPFAVDLLHRGVSLENLSAQLGHKNLKITQRHYSAFTPARRDALKDARPAGVEKAIAVVTQNLLDSSPAIYFT